MGRNKYSNKEINGIAKLLRLKNSANRAKQKELRHKLRVDYEFNISDFNVPLASKNSTTQYIVEPSLYSTNRPLPI